MTQQVAYCTNVHAGTDLATTRENLDRYAVNVKRQHAPDHPMGVGLWLANSAATELVDSDNPSELAAWLDERGLVPFTFNGFPFGDFHQQVVKHSVYEPTWFDRRRLEYTRRLIAIQHALLPAGMNGSISTLPIAWGTPPPGLSELEEAGRMFRAAAETMAELEQNTGRTLCLCIEPEPGCYLERADDIVRFFEDYLLPGKDEHVVRRHIGICHDVCHSAVMFEDQREALERYAAAGLRIGKVQISSAVKLALGDLDDQAREAALDQLAQFAEDRYLHQTNVRAADGTTTFFEDLPLALAGGARDGEWRVHFHVPIYLDSFGLISTSQSDIADCLAGMAHHFPDTQHFEVETYAWGVLPPELQADDLATGIAREMEWFTNVVVRSANQRDRLQH